MDPEMQPERRGALLMTRLEYGLALLVCVVLALMNFAGIRWLPFVAAFAIIDLAGYLPGALAHRKASGERVGRIYYTLYNTTHSALFGALLVSLWWSWAGGPEWAMLAVPIHLCGDRAIFGNFFKNPREPFEPPAPKRASHIPPDAIGAQRRAS